MDKISVFGGAGFIGSYFVDSRPLEEAFVEPRYNCIPMYPDILYLISTLHNYHPKDGELFIDIDTNLVHFMNVLELAVKKFGNKLTFNLISTWFVYGNKPKIPSREDDYCDPKGFYSITARAREQLLISYCETFGINYRIMRLGNVIGIGDKKISLKKNALQYFCRELAQGRPIERYKQGSVRDYVDVRDCVRGINLVLEKGELNQIYNIANGQGLDVKNLIDHAWAVSGYKSKITEVDIPQFHKTVQTPAIYMDISKIQSLGYVKQNDIKTSIEELVHYYEREPQENS